MRLYQCYTADIENIAPTDRLPMALPIFGSISTGKSRTQSSRKVADVVTLAVFTCDAMI